MITPQEYAIRLRSQAEQLRKSNLPLKIAATSAHTLMIRRIFTDGLNANDGSIGSYSNKDIWINPKTDTFEARNQKGFNPLKGKKGNTEFKSNPSRQRKTSYFKGWGGFRDVQLSNVTTKNVNLNYTGDMGSDFANVSIQVFNSKSRREFTPIYVNVNEYVAAFQNPLNAKKATGNEEHFGVTIFKLTPSEKAAFYKAANFEIKKLLQS